jgi:hypothetical protein
MLSKLFGLSLVAILIVILPLLSSNTYTTANIEETTFRGKLVCPGCELKESNRARAACNTYGHRFALKVDDGFYVKFLENMYSEDLIKGKKYPNKEMVIHGKYYSSANMIDVSHFEVDGEEISWCRHCREMDDCATRAKETP